MFDYVVELFIDFYELYGDCVFVDDLLIVGGFVCFGGYLCMVIGY